ncbi:MAG: gliding motility-associated C-terminal domain-containing protein [Cytophagaceae bacterium]
MRQVILLLFVKPILLLVSSAAFAQVYQIPDAGLKQCFIEKYPEVLNQNNELVINNAKARVGDLICSNYNIEDISGIQYFENITILTLGNNKISDINLLASMPKLEQIYIYNNNLSTLPSFTSLANLKSLHVEKNNISGLPELPISIQNLFIAENNIGSLKEIGQYINLTELYSAMNAIDTIADLSNLTKLKVLHLGSNKLRTIKGLDKLNNMERLFLEENQIGPSINLSHMTKLRDMYLSNCGLKSINNFSNHNLLVNAYLVNNNLTFEDILPQTAHPDFNNVFQYYYLQDSVGEKHSIILKEGDDFRFGFDFDKNLSSNIYKWYKNGILFSTSSSDSLKLPRLKLEDSGVYHCVISNTHPLLNEMHLKSRSIKLNITPCISANDISFHITPFDCRNQGAINIEVIPTETAGWLKKIGTTDSIRLNKGINKIDIAGTYIIQILKDADCRYSEQIDITDNRDNCTEYTFTPNGDGIDDTFYISEAGKAQVFDKAGRLVAEVNTPAAWDGTDSNGRALGYGYYLIKVNEDQIYRVSLLK